jgi:hypothetical protein
MRGFNTLATRSGREINPVIVARMRAFQWVMRDSGSFLRLASILASENAKTELFSVFDQCNDHA